MENIPCAKHEAFPGMKLRISTCNKAWDSQEKKRSLPWNRGCDIYMLLECSSGPMGVALGPLPAHKTLAEGLRPVKPSSETVMPISQPSPGLSIHAKAQEQSNKTILQRELPERCSLMGVKPSSWVVLVLASLVHVNICAIVKPTVTGKKEVSMVKEKSAVRHSPLPKAALMLLKPAPISYLQTPPAPSSKNGTLSSQVFPMQHTYNAIKMHQIVGKMTHHAIETWTRVLLKPTALWVGEMHAAGVLEHFEKCSVVVTRHAVSFKNKGEMTSVWQCHQYQRRKKWK